MSRDHLRRHVLGHGLPGFRAEQMFAWVYQKRVRDPLEMTNLPLTFRRSLPAICDFALPETASVHSSPDGNTHKFVLRLADGARVESVSMRTPRRLTFCISSQVGCALKCSFCATGLMGLKRNLKSHEIVAQVMAWAISTAGETNASTSCTWAWASRSPAWHVTERPHPPMSVDSASAHAASR
jgi:23S rRNA (adenine2503-C2)-methyltransferase